MSLKLFFHLSVVIETLLIFVYLTASVSIEWVMMGFSQEHWALCYGRLSRCLRHLILPHRALLPVLLLLLIQLPAL